MSQASWFPGRWIGGLSLVLGPLLLLTGVLLRLPLFFSLPREELAALQARPTFFPLELAAFDAHPRLITASYGVFLLGNVLLWPAIIALAHFIGRTGRPWGLWGGTLAMLGLFGRTFHAGVDYFAFQLVRAQSLELATKAVADSYRAISYGPLDSVGVLGFAVLFGWIVLAIGAYRSGTLGPLRSLTLGLSAFLLQGVLKGGTVAPVIECLGLCIALLPLGVRVLQASHATPISLDATAAV